MSIGSVFLLSGMAQALYSCGFAGIGRTPNRVDYEIYYQQISLYYSFSKNFDTPMDEQWVAQTRAQVSKRIQTLMERD